MAISSPLLEDLSIDGAHGVLINITGGPDLSLFEVNEASTLIQEAAHEDANIIFGAVIDESMPEGEMRVTVIATGLVDERVRRGRDGTTHREVSRGREVREDRSANVTPIRPYSEPAPMSAYAEPQRTPQQAPLLEPAPERGRQSPIEFVSPFEDELDVPAFLRKRNQSEKDEEEEREQPAFLRRSAD
jgi:cell division protein FtsZ